MIKKISKFFIFVLFAVVCFISTGCGVFKEMFSVDLIDNEGSIKLDIEEEYKKYFPYELPSYEITFDGIVHTTEHRTTTREVIFTKNDDFKVSEILSNIFEKYKALGRFYTYQSSIDNEGETYLISYENNPDGEKVYFKVLDKKIYNEVCYINLENGLILTCSYARIVDENNNVYYRWQNSESIRMILHYPFMVTENKQGETMFLLVPLPAGVIYGFDTTTKELDTLLSKDKFKTDKSYYTYDYINNWNVETVKQFYIDKYNGRVVNNEFLVDYFGYTFMIEFNEKNFVINYVGETPQAKIYDFKVVSGSMEPTLKTGKTYQFIETDVNKLEAGDIILFQQDDNKYVSRIVQVVMENGEICFIVKADANAISNVDPVKGSQVLGKLK